MEKLSLVNTLFTTMDYTPHHQTTPTIIFAKWSWGNRDYVIEIPCHIVHGDGGMMGVAKAVK
jgi:hypothetical protein